jgi:hypothetical protein
MKNQRITLLDGQLGLSIYHDASEDVDEDAIKLDFREATECESWRIFRGDHVRVGINLTEAKELLSQLQAAIDESESVR